MIKMKKRIIKLTESDLIKLVSKVISEQEENSPSFDDCIYGIEQIHQELFFSHHDDITEEDLNYAHDAIAQILNHAENNKKISDDEFEELYDFADEMSMEINNKFESMNGLNERVEDDLEDEEEEEIHPARARQLSHFDPDEFTLIGKIKAVAVPPSKTPLFVLRNKNKTEDGTRILDGLYGYEDKIVKLTGRTKDGNPPSFQNPMKLTKRPQVLSR
jgi:hypothetical protein